MDNYTGTSIENNCMPPKCEKHNRQMVLYFYPRPSSAPGNAWSCPDCTAVRTKHEKIEKLLSLIRDALKDL